MSQAPKGRPRTGARVAAVQALFQSEASGESAETVMNQFLRHRIGPQAGESFDDGRVAEADSALFISIVKKAGTHSVDLDAIISTHLAAGWPITKLDPVLRALLRAAAAELRDGKEPPARVIIREYLDIAHGFFTGEEPRFAAGVLDALARTLRPSEFTG
ncbi:transcription antitermination factor NusB [Rhodovarius crocodyli]|uniref:Transcription antitermination protein NusB n=1 Tax=Rhodovarius crocodyli TaxID=1979269 RepID=A0A437M1K2_9PROT|nr:transcription antitermination factor NusB [Rhodovarius crocodyli]RVT91591.1 transcription antitermination factor NusB [Rhodovarius crocodyli]